MGHAKKEDNMQHSKHEYGSQLVENINRSGVGSRRSRRSKAKEARSGRIKRHGEAQGHRKQSKTHTEQRFSEETITKMIGITRVVAMAVAAIMCTRLRKGRQTQKKETNKGKKTKKGKELSQNQ
jgi:hypothetical protein